MTLSTPILVLTATIRPSNVPYCPLSDPEERLLQYLSSLLLWIEESPVRTLIFCENSGVSLDLSCVEKIAAGAGKHLRLLSCPRDGSSSRYGKGFGEGAMLDHVFSVHGLLVGKGPFFKVTGRLFIKNMADVLGAHESHRNVFAEFDTRFWKSDVEFYLSELSRSHLEVDDRAGTYLEHVYDRRLKPLIGSSRASRFLVSPKFLGQSASTLERYGDFPSSVLERAARMKPIVF